ncbi:hypothetical protein EDC04DRAFT_2627099 [Pisolithus marmoratus]|nr:hypothetical protein EDC04DRAFT_2627099 [Pisolithus marmoratus]
MDEQQRLIMTNVPTHSNRRNALSVMQRFYRCIFQVLLGTSSLESLHQISQQDGEAWNELRGRLSKRTQNINIIGTLLVAGLATFLTTSPSTDLAKWDGAFTYFCIGAAYVISTLAVASGLCLLVFLDIMSPKSIEAAQNSTFKFLVLLMLLMLPLTLLFSAGLVAGLAFLLAVTLGDNVWMKVAAWAAAAATCVVLLVLLFTLEI